MKNFFEGVVIVSCVLTALGVWVGVFSLRGDKREKSEGQISDIRRKLRGTMDNFPASLDVLRSGTALHIDPALLVEAYKEELMDSKLDRETKDSFASRARTELAS